MSFSRRFLVAPSLVRMLIRDLGAHPVVEGHFANQPGRSSYVRLAGDSGALVLIRGTSEVSDEEWTDIPRAHAEALLDVASGRVAYTRIRLARRDFEIDLDRFVEPGHLSLATVTCKDGQAIERFQPPSWFGEEVTAIPGYRNRQIALEGAAPVRDVPLTDVALHECLDMLENRSDIGGEADVEDNSDASETVDALLRFASAFSASAPAQEEPAPPPEPVPEPSPPAKASSSEDEETIRALAWSLRPQSSRKKDKRRS